MRQRQRQQRLDPCGKLAPRQGEPVCLSALNQFQREVGLCGQIAPERGGQQSGGSAVGGGRKRQGSDRAIR